MGGRPFLDTNVLIYAFTNDRRKARATRLIALGGVVSVQVLNEFADVARRKLGRDWASIRAALATIRAVVEPPVPLTMEIHESALDLSDRHGFRLYDSLILAAAEHAGCPILYSEDLQDGQVIGGVRVSNPFLGV